MAESDRLWDTGRVLKNKFDIPFENFSLENMAYFEKGTPWDRFIQSGFNIVYKRPYGN